MGKVAFLRSEDKQLVAAVEQCVQLLKRGTEEDSNKSRIMYFSLYSLPKAAYT